MTSSEILHSNSPSHTSPSSEKPIHIKFLSSKPEALNHKFETRCSVRLSSHSHFFPGTSDRIIMVSGGALDDVLDAVDNIRSKVQDEGSDELDPERNIKLVVPITSCVEIVGRYGATIRSIIKESGAGIKISSEDQHYPDLQDRLVTLIGTLAEQRQAIKLILPLLIEDICYQRWVNVPFPIAVQERISSISRISYSDVSSSLPPDIARLINNHFLPETSAYLMLVDQREANFPEVTNGRPDTMLVPEITKKLKRIEYEEFYRRKFYNISTLETHEIYTRHNLSRMRCFSIGFGWLLTVGANLEIQVNRIARQDFYPMPSMDSLQWKYNAKQFGFKKDKCIHFFIRKVVLSSAPGNDDCIVLVLYSPRGRLAFARPGEKHWCSLEDEFNFTDIIFFRGNFFAIDRNGHLYFCSTQSFKVTQLTSNPLGFKVDEKYLVEIENGLYVVVRQRVQVIKSPPTYETVRFYVYRIEKDEHDDYVYTRVMSLGDSTIFLGSNPSVSLTSFQGIKKNAIYYSEDDPVFYVSQPSGGGHDTGVYDMGSHTFTKIHIGTKFTSHLTPPMWVIP